LQTLAQVFEAIGARKERDASADAALKLAQAQSEWQQRLLTDQQEGKTLEDNYAENRMREFQTYSSNLVATGKTRASKTFLRERTAALGGALGTDLLAAQFKAREDDALRKYEESAKITATNAELDPDRYQVRLAEQLAALDSLPVSADKKTATKIAVADLVQTRAGVGFARRDPDATMQRLLSPSENDTLFRTLSPKGRDEVLQEVEATQRMKLQAEELAYRKAERAEKDVADSVAKEGDRLLAEGNLTTRWIEQNRDRLDPQDHRYFYSQLSGGSGGPRNIERYLSLRDAVSRGADVRDDARDALRRHEIGPDDYDRLVSKVETQRPGWYDRGTNYITTAGKPNDLNPEEGAPQRLASMLDDWDDWSDAHPKATVAEAQTEYQRIVEEYGLIRQRGMTLNMRAPRFLVGTRDAPDLDATARETVRRFQAGEIDQGEAERQALLIKQWRSALGPQQKAKP